MALNVISKYVEFWKVYNSGIYFSTNQTIALTKAKTVYLQDFCRSFYS